MGRALSLGLGAAAVAALGRPREARADSTGEPAQTLLADTIKRIEDFVLPKNKPVADWSVIVAQAQAQHPEGLTLYFGRRTYNFAKPLHIHTCLRLLGATGSGYDSSSVLQFQGAGDGIVIHSASTAAAIGLSGTGQGSILEGLQILGTWGGFQQNGSHPPIGNGNGITVYMKCTIRECVVQYFPGDGIHVLANAVADGTNANNWSIESVVISQVGGNGLSTAGADANAGVAKLVTVTNSGLSGIWEGSHLGNVYLGCDVEAAGRLGQPGTGSYKALPADGIPVANNQSLFLGCYSEQATVIECGVVFGGYLAADDGIGGVAVQFAPGVPGYSAEGMRVSPGIGSWNNFEPAVPVFGVVGSLAAAGRVAFEWGTGGAVYRLKYGATAGPDGYWWFNYGGGDAGFALGLGTGTGNSVSPWNDGRAIVSMYYGARVGTAQVFVDSGDGPPAGPGSWAPGDRILNRSPVPGGYAGWIFTSAGWKGFGLIESLVCWHPPSIMLGVLRRFAT